MSLVIMAYTKEVLKEFYLPVINNADYSVHISQQLFSLPEDIEVTLEIVDNKWRFSENYKYRILGQNHKNYFGIPIKDGDVLELITASNAAVAFVIIESEQAFQVFHKYDLTGLSEVFIGSDSNNNIQYDMLNFISRNHASLQYHERGWILYDTSTNGIFYNSMRIHNSLQLKFGDRIEIFGLLIVYLGNMLAVSPRFGSWKVKIHGLTECYFPADNHNTDSKIRKDKVFFKRSPRNMETLFQEDVEIEAPPVLQRKKPKPLFMTIGPAFTMAIPMLLGSGISLFAARSMGSGGGAYMFTGIITALGSAVVGVFWALSNIKYEKQDEIEQKEHRLNSYGQYIIDIADYLKVNYENNIRILNERYIAANDCAQFNENNPALWSRNFGHDDFLYVRLGIGDLPFQANIITPKKKFTMDMDELSRKPDEIKETYKTLYNVPVGIDLLKKNLVGIVGGYHKTGAIEVLKAMVAQIAVNNSYTDVKMAFLCDAVSEEEKEIWGFAKWLPHVWSEDRRVRFVADNKGDARDVCYELAKIIRTRTEETEGKDKSSVISPHYIIFVANPELLEGELLMKYAIQPKKEYGITTVILSEQYSDLPNSCEDIIQNDGSELLLYSVSENSQQVKRIQADYIDSAKLERLTRRLSGIEVNAVEQNGELPNAIDFFEMYGVHSLEALNVEDRWIKNRTYDNMKALIGKKGGNAPCYLDVHEKYHGPHGLVAGTTGSGKSETLQTYILSLAVNFSPYDVGFFIIDYKGGGMANLFSDLPHLIGQISNLSGSQVRRAMISIKSENKRRQRIFTENNVNNINLYTRLYKNGEATIPVPHLFIIIDEFAELKREEPEFMKELISVAQVGRSLGVHLILATQKPSGTVDDNIWSNSKFRLCLRVQDRQDSNDMLHKPDAAYITQAGRGYLQVGNDELYELFQSGYSGGVFDKDSLGGRTSIATMVALTGKTALVGNKTKKKRAEEKQLEWIECLVGIIHDITHQLQCTAHDVYYNPPLFESMIKALFTKIQEHGYDYDDTPYNQKRILSMLEIWPVDDTKLDGTGVLSNREVTERIIQQSVEKSIKLPEIKDKTQLDAVVEYLGTVADKNGYKQSMMLWLPVLPHILGFDQLQGYSEQCFDGNNWRHLDPNWTLNTMIGLYDDPENQAQNSLLIDFAENGHHAVCGTVATGKSTFLQSLVYSMICKYNPDQLNVYVLDYSSHMMAMFEHAPHVGGIVYEKDEEKMKRFFNMMESVMDDRKALLQGSNYSQYVHTHGVVIPAIMIVIDNFAGFNEKTGGVYEEIVLRLSREGVGYGIFLVISSAGFGLNEIPSRIGDNIRTVISLDMGDSFKMAEVLRANRLEVLPETGVKGRGLAVVNDNYLEFQTAIAGGLDDDYKRSQYIEDQCDQMQSVWTKSFARRIPEIPEKPVMSEYMKLPEYVQEVQKGDYLPIGYYASNASLYGVDLKDTYCYTISGKSRTGKTNVLKNLMYTASKTAGKIYVIENSGSELKLLSSELGAQYLTSDEEIFDFFRSTIPLFKERNQKKQQLLASGVEEEELYSRMTEFEHIYIFIANIPEFIQCIYKVLDNGTTMNGYLENITEKGRHHNFFFFGCLNTDEAADAIGYKVYSNYLEYQTGIHVGGRITSVQSIYNYTNIPFSEQDKVMKKGLGIVPSAEDPSLAETVVIPLAKGV